MLLLFFCFFFWSVIVFGARRTRSGTVPVDHEYTVGHRQNDQPHSRARQCRIVQLRFGQRFPPEKTVLPGRRVHMQVQSEHGGEKQNEKKSLLITQYTHSAYVIHFTHNDNNNNNMIFVIDNVHASFGHCLFTWETYR